MSKYLCIDCSGSTSRNTNYIKTVRKIINEHSDDSIFILWDDKSKQYTKQQALDYSFEQGNGTYPKVLVPYLNENSDVTIITDGQIGTNDVQETDNNLNNRYFKNVNVHFINTGGSMNLSVSAPFTRNCDKYSLYVDDKLLSDGSGLINLEPYYDNPVKFLNEADDLLKNIIVQNIGRKNIDLHHKLVKLKDNLLKVLSDSKTNIFENINLKNYEQGFKQITNIILIIDSSVPQQIENIIQEMISKCSGSYDFSFNQLSNRVIRSANIDNIYPEEDLSENTQFECPITMVDDIPVLLIGDDNTPHVFLDLEKSYVDDIITNPFKVLQNNTLITKIKSKLDSIIGLNTYLTLKDDTNKSPYTRNNIIGVFAFGDHETHIKCSKFAMSSILFGNNKLVGNIVLWLCVFYLIIKNHCQYINENQEFMSIFKTRLFSWLTTMKTNITLSGLPISPVIKSSVDIALWYSLTVSPFIAPKNDSSQNRLRSFGNSSRFMLEIIDDILQYDYPKEKIRYLINLYSAFNWMSYMNKSENPNIKNYWNRIIRAQYQNSIIIDSIDNDYSNLIMLDGQGQPNYTLLSTLPFGTLPINEWVYLSSIVDSSKKNGDIYIDLDISSNFKIPEFVNNYGYSEKNEKTIINIDPEIMRPFKIVNNVPWIVLAEKTCPINKQISLYNYFVNCVKYINRYPSKNEFIKYLDKKVNNSTVNNRNTLPFHINEFIDELYKNYEKVNYTELSVLEFIKRSNR